MAIEGRRCWYFQVPAKVPAKEVLLGFRPMQPSPSDTPVPPARFRWTWASFLSLATALIAVGSATLHLVGSIWHRNYLSYWGVDAELFPQSTDQVMLTGFYALFDRLLLLFIALVKEWYLLLLGVALLFLLAMYIDALTDRAVDAVVKVAHSGRPWRKRVVQGLMLGLTFASFALLATFVLVAMMGIPAAAAEMSARKSAEANAEDFAKGCAASKRSCVEIQRAGQPPVQGYLLESSPTHLAIFDAGIRRSRTMSRDGVEVISAKKVVAEPLDAAN